MDKALDIQEVVDSLESNDVLNRLEKFSVFLDTLVNNVTEDVIPEEDVSKIVEHIKLQKRIYENAHKLYESIKEENYVKEKANSNFGTLRETLDEYMKFKSQNLQ